MTPDSSKFLFLFLKSWCIVGTSGTMMNRGADPAPLSDSKGIHDSRKTNNHRSTLTLHHVTSAESGYQLCERKGKPPGQKTVPLRWAGKAGLWVGQVLGNTNCPLRVWGKSHKGDLRPENAARDKELGAHFSEVTHTSVWTHTAPALASPQFTHP